MSLSIFTIQQTRRESNHCHYSQASGAGSQNPEMGTALMEARVSPSAVPWWVNLPQNVLLSTEQSSTPEREITEMENFYGYGYFLFSIFTFRVWYDLRRRSGRSSTWCRGEGVHMKQHSLMIPRRWIPVHSERRSLSECGKFWYHFKAEWTKVRCGWHAVFICVCVWLTAAKSRL